MAVTDLFRQTIKVRNHDRDCEFSFWMIESEPCTDNFPPASLNLAFAETFALDLQGAMSSDCEITSFRAEAVKPHLKIKSKIHERSTYGQRSQETTPLNIYVPIESISMFEDGKIAQSRIKFPGMVTAAVKGNELDFTSAAVIALVSFVDKLLNNGVSAVGGDTGAWRWGSVLTTKDNGSYSPFAWSQVDIAQVGAEVSTYRSRNNRYDGYMTDQETL